jgi:phosphopantothenoylcysteine decarboxylase/phosphopantothenate--cysteine ligase
VKDAPVKRVLITAGPTREKIDPVRFISNYSTGSFGYEIAKAARRSGLKVILISGPTTLKAPRGVKFISIESAREMLSAVLENVKRCDCVIMASAVCDWRPASISANKIKKGRGRIMLELVQNPDILKQLGRRKRAILAGFALETENLERNARKKLHEKNLDIIIANRLKAGRSPFGKGKTDVLIIDRAGGLIKVQNKPKAELAKIIVDKVLNCNIY